MHSNKVYLKCPNIALIEQKKERFGTFSTCMTIQILHYEFLGPIKLSEWGPPMDKVIFVILAREKDTFNVIYVEQSEKTDKNDFFTKNEKFKCWLTHAGSEENLYLSIYLMPNSDEKDRQRIVTKAISHYKPICNVED